VKQIDNEATILKRKIDGAERKDAKPTNTRTMSSRNSLGGSNEATSSGTRLPLPDTTAFEHSDAFATKRKRPRRVVCPSPPQKTPPKSRVFKAPHSAPVHLLNGANSTANNNRINSSLASTNDFVVTTDSALVDSNGSVGGDDGDGDARRAKQQRRHSDRPLPYSREWFPLCDFFFFFFRFFFFFFFFFIFLRATLPSQKTCLFKLILNVHLSVLVCLAVARMVKCIAFNGAAAVNYLL
jgi:hypothetical protein